MKKKIALAALILSAGLTFTACDAINEVAQNLPWNSQEASEETTTAAPDASETTTEASEATTTSSSETTEGDPSAEGGNPDIAHYIEVTVSEDKYFYENHEISYDDLMDVLDGLDGNTAVRISDEKATLKAYENLTNALEEREILFETAG